MQPLSRLCFITSTLLLLVVVRPYRAHRHISPHMGKALGESLRGIAPLSPDAARPALSLQCGESTRKLLRHRSSVKIEKFPLAKLYWFCKRDLFCLLAL